MVRRSGNFRLRFSWRGAVHGLNVLHERTQGVVYVALPIRSLLLEPCECVPVELKDCRCLGRGGLRGVNKLGWKAVRGAVVGHDRTLAWERYSQYKRIMLNYYLRSLRTRLPRERFHVDFCLPLPHDVDIMPCLHP